MIQLILIMIHLVQIMFKIILEMILTLNTTEISSNYYNNISPDDIILLDPNSEAESDRGIEDE